MNFKVIFHLLLLYLNGSKGQEHAPVFLLEPQPLLVFSNSTGARISCAAHGYPEPQINWLLADGNGVDNVPGLRHVLDNGTLVFSPFSATQYRQDVHSALYRCKAQNVHGTILSRDMKTKAIVWQDWTVRVTSNVRVETGGPALLKCSPPSSIKEHLSVVSWYRDDQAILQTVDDLAGRYQVINDGWSLIVRNVRPEESRHEFACTIIDNISGERKRSNSLKLDVKYTEESSPPRSLTHTVWEVDVKRGMDAVLPCLVNAYPLPTINWYRESSGGSLKEISMSTGRLSRGADVLVIRRADVSDAGRWACRADNPHGHATVYVVLMVHAPLAVSVAPQLQVVNSGSTATINCTSTGWPTGKLEWLHNGSPIVALTNGAGSRIRMLDGGKHLIIASVYRGDKGVYQCMARNDKDSAQAGSELRLGDTSPELQYTFIEQALRPGQLVTLKCSAVGTPPPHFSWLLDGYPLNTVTRGHRFAMDQFMTTVSNEVVGHLNISSVRAEDGGLYTCKAANTLGEVSHTARLNIYGPPYVRDIGPIRAVAGRELTMYCPYSGYPISSVRWERAGKPVESESQLNNEGALFITTVLKSHAGAYSCTVTGIRGEAATREIQLLVSNPPEIEPFSFSTNLQEGKRAQVSCSVNSGDMPVYFTWFKDNAPIPASLEVEERGAEFFSNLVFKDISSRHSGVYTCVASNSAAKVNYSSELVVKVPPKWIAEPGDVAVLAGETLALNCLTKGSPTPHISWLKQRVGAVDFIPVINLGGRYQFLTNGTLWIESASSFDEGHYMCKAENDVGDPISKTILVTVNEPVTFEIPSKNLTARRDVSATLICDVHGDDPIQVQWTHNMNRLDLNTYRISVSEMKTETGMRSQLFISRTDRSDSGVYKCQAVNTYGHNDHYIHLSVLEKPDSPHSLSVTDIGSRSVRLSWIQGFDGNSPLVGYTLQYNILSTQQSHSHTRTNQWDGAITVNISVHDTNIPGSNNIILTANDNLYEALVPNLKPHTAYMMRIFSINQIDKSSYTEPIVVKTNEEAPSEPPLGVHAVPGGPGELRVSWRAPPRESWNGELLGFSVVCEALAAFNHSRTLTVNGWSGNEVVVGGLKKFTRYQVTVKAFNGVAAGPPSNPVTATTLEGVPEAPPTRVSCMALSSVSIKVSWNPPPLGQHGGLIQGYKVVYTSLSITKEEVNEPEVKRVTTTETYLHALHKFTNYSIQVLAFTNAGDGKKSLPVFCKTDEDVPSAPQKIKALANSAESILVSWQEPLHPNGIITHYTIFHREAGRIGKHSSYVVSVDKLVEGELAYEVKDLIENQLYEFWVSATTGSGEGEITPVAAQGPNSRAPARIASWGSKIVRAAGSRAILWCVVGGFPRPRSRWTHQATPVTHHALYHVTARGHLVITEVKNESSGNFTCTASNIFGEDAITYSVAAILPPDPPFLSLQYTTSSSIKVHWQSHKDSGSPVLGYQLFYKAEKDTLWQTVEFGPDSTSYTMESQKCGTRHEIKIRAKNLISTGPFSEVLKATTRGAVPKAPKLEDFAVSNSTTIKINLYSWRDGGCPLLGFWAEYRRASDNSWINLSESAGSASLVIKGLISAQWYEIRVVARNDAGTTELKMLIDTLKPDGGRIPPLQTSTLLSNSKGVTTFGTILISGIATTVVVVTGLAAAFCVLKGRKKVLCFSNHRYKRDQRAMSVSHETEREKLQEGQKLYSSSSINNEKCTDDSSAELYEISPYATFGVGTNTPGIGSTVAPPVPIASGGVHSLHFRTFSRHEDEAPPPRRSHHRRPCDHYHYGNYEESSLSKAATVEARYRLSSTAWPQQHHSEESDSDTNANTKSSTSPPTYSSGGGGGRARSRSARGCRYHQRKEQERRECTIHV